MGAAASRRGGAAIRESIDAERRNRQYGQGYVDSLTLELDTVRMSLVRSTNAQKQLAAELDQARALIRRLRAERDVLRDEVDTERRVKAIHNRARQSAESRLVVVTEHRNVLDKALRRRLSPDEYREALAFERD
jgi:hypothetical protein